MAAAANVQPIQPTSMTARRRTEHSAAGPLLDSNVWVGSWWVLPTTEDATAAGAASPDTPCASTYGWGLHVPAP